MWRSPARTSAPSQRDGGPKNSPSYAEKLQSWGESLTNTKGGSTTLFTRSTWWHRRNTAKQSNTPRNTTGVTGLKKPQTQTSGQHTDTSQHLLAMAEKQGYHFSQYKTQKVSTPPVQTRAKA